MRYDRYLIKSWTKNGLKINPSWHIMGVFLGTKTGEHELIRNEMEGIRYEESKFTQTLCRKRNFKK
jgi:hypothetical protein